MISGHSKKKQPNPKCNDPLGREYYSMSLFITSFVNLNLIFKENAYDVMGIGSGLCVLRVTQ